MMLHKKTLCTMGLNDQRGTILVMIVVMIVVSAIAFSTALYVLGDAISAKRQMLTMERLREVEAALIGHPHAFLNEATSNYGYLSRQTTLTTSVGALADLQNNLVGHPSTQDAYGNNIQLNISGSTYSIHSYGPNGVNNGGSGDDINIQFSTANLSTVDISAMIIDATESGVSGLRFAGVTGSVDNSYVVDSGGDNAINGRYDGHTLFGPVFDGVLGNSDVTLTLHSAPSFDGGGGVAPNRFNRTTGSFEWDNISVGAHLLRIQGAVAAPAAGFDPEWDNVNNNRMHTPIFINPADTTSRRQFNVIYPVVAEAESLQENGGDQCDDETVTSNANHIWTALNDPDQNDAAPWTESFRFQSVGYGCPDYWNYDSFAGTYTNRRMRTLLRFDLTQLPGISNTSKVTFAQLRLTTHQGSGGNLAWDSGSWGSGTINLYRYSNNWNEVVPGADPYVPNTDGAVPWTSVLWASGNLSDLQDSFNFNASTGVDPTINFDVTEAVQNWTRGSWANQGFIIYKTADWGTPAWYSFIANDASDNLLTAVDETQLRPKLIVSYYR